MEASSIVLMERINGILDKELGSYVINEGIECVLRAFVENSKVVMDLSTIRDVDDEEYTRLFDEYDARELEALGVSVTEDDEQYNPVWHMEFDFIEEHDQMQEMLNKIFICHMKNLNSIIK